MNKKYLMFGILSLFAIVLVSAAVYTYIGSASVDVTVNEALSVSPVPISFSAFPGNTETTNVKVNNLADVPLNVEFSWTETSNEALFSLDNSGEGVGGNCGGYPVEGWQDKCEKRIIIDEPMALSDLDTISWDANVKEGYLPHIDVILSNGKTLIFEGAKSTFGEFCDATPYPDGELSTFGIDRGEEINGDTYAWENGPIPGPCGDSAFETIHKPLSEWKTVYNEDVTILRFELEVDNWISASNSDVWNIAINGNEIKVDYELITLSAVIPNGLNNLIPVSFIVDGASPVGEFAGVINVERV